MRHGRVLGLAVVLAFIGLCAPLATTGVLAAPNVTVPPPPSGCGWTYWSGSAQTSLLTDWVGISDAEVHIDVCHYSDGVPPIHIQCVGYGSCTLLQGPEWLYNGSNHTTAYVEIEVDRLGVVETTECSVKFYTSSSSNWIGENCT